MSDENLQLSSGPRRRDNQCGFTLIEVLIATGLGLLALSAFAAFHGFQLTALRNQATQIDVQSTTRSLSDLFAREVRRAGLDPTCAKTFQAIPNATDHSVRILADLNGSGAIDGTDEDITYRANEANNAIERVANGRTDVLLTGISLEGSALFFYDAAGNRLVPNEGAYTAAQLLLVRRIEFDLALTGQEFKAGAAPHPRAQMSTVVDLRNRFFLDSTACP